MRNTLRTLVIIGAAVSATAMTHTSATAGGLDPADMTCPQLWDEVSDRKDDHMHPRKDAMIKEGFYRTTEDGKKACPAFRHLYCRNFGDKYGQHCPENAPRHMDVDYDDVPPPPYGGLKDGGSKLPPLEEEVEVVNPWRPQIAIGGGYEYWDVPGSKVTPDGLHGGNVNVKVYGPQYKDARAYVTGGVTFYGDEEWKDGPFNLSTDGLKMYSIGGGVERQLTKRLKGRVGISYDRLEGDVNADATITSTTTTGCGPCGKPKTVTTTTHIHDSAKVEGDFFNLNGGLSFGVTERFSLDVDGGYHIGDIEVDGSTVDADSGFVRAGGTLRF